MRCLLLTLLLSSWSFWLIGQELPPVVSFEADAYGAGTQNWMIGQDEDQFVYAANNQGLLEYNGQEWMLYPSPNETILRSVFATGGRIYTGSYMEFGAWERATNGTLHYHSLSDSLTDKILPDEQFWNIFPHEGYIVFQSLNQFFLHNSEQGTSSTLSPANGIVKAFPTSRGIFFTDGKNHLHRLSGGLLIPLEASESEHTPIVHLWEEGGEFYAQSSESGTYRLVGDQLIADDRFPFLAGQQIYCATDLRLGGTAFGTVSDGVYIVDQEGTLQYHLTLVDGLTNNTILSLYEDRQNNLWAGTDNGISYVTLSSPFRKYTDITGRLGTIHGSAVHEGKIYLGSNQGLFSRPIDGPDDFRLVPGTRGQVWSLFKHGNNLFGGHDRGAFTVRNGRADFIFSESGVWTFSTVPGRSDILLQGTYKGIWVLEKRGLSWKPRNQIEGFDYSSRFLAVPRPNEVYISHEYRGVFGIKLDNQLTRVTERKDYTSPEKGKNAGITAFKEEVFYYSKEGLFRLQDFSSGFQRDSTLVSDYDRDDYTSGKTTAVGNRLWFFAEHELGFLHPGTLTADLQRQTVPVSAELINAKSGYENISSVGNDTFLIGTADGYLLLALAAVPLHQHKLYLTRATASTRTGESIQLSLAGGDNLPHAADNLSFHFAVPAYHKYFRPYFRYRLLGLAEEWSEWTTSSSISYPGLTFGDYTLEVESLLGKRQSESPFSYSFTVLRPWYASYPAFLFYLLVSIGLIYLLHRTYTGHYRRKQVLWREENERQITAERREAELTLTRITNERLEADIDSKNREMAISTMSLVRKNELLQQIKAELLAGKDPSANIRRVVKTIDQSINEAETWSLFRDAFENADRGFFKEIKSLHSELTPTDLKLCAYLRLNLSSKEIAPLLNISVRSVEVKRYRLRKKMGLAQGAGLVDYIMAL